MCGITGFWTRDPEIVRDADAQIARMLEPIRLRAGVM